MSTCALPIDKIINNYTKYGWFELTTIFNKQKFGKEKNTRLYVNESLLELLGNIRKYIIDNIFNCVNKDKDTYFVAFGSTNITSDYDLTIVGKNASQVMYDMFHLFLKKYGNTLPYTYDSNIYPDGLYLTKGLNTYIDQIIKLDDTTSIILPYTESDYKYSMSMACIKLLDFNINMTKLNNLKFYLEHAKQLHAKLKKDYNSTLSLIKRKFKTKRYNKAALDLITKVELNYKNSKKLYNILYKKNSPKHIIKYQTHSSFFSIEAYYCSSTIAVIVYEIQAKKKMKLKKQDYICALIENLGDMYHHITEEIQHTTKPFKSILLKYSKYIYRIYFCLSKITNIPAIKTKAKKINSDVIPNRKTGNVKNIDFKLLDYNNETPTQYIDKFILNMVEHIDSNL